MIQFFKVIKPFLLVLGLIFFLTYAALSFFLNPNWGIDLIFILSSIFLILNVIILVILKLEKYGINGFYKFIRKKNKEKYSIKNWKYLIKYFFEIQSFGIVVYCITIICLNISIRNSVLYPLIKDEIKSKFFYENLYQIGIVKNYSNSKGQVKILIPVYSSNKCANLEFHFQKESDGHIELLKVRSKL